MLKELKIQNYRGIQNFEIDGFSRLNLIVGKNNSKKTTILESIYLNTSYASPSSFVQVTNSRNLRLTSSNMKSLFNNLDTKKKIKINGKYTLKKNKEKDINIDITHLENQDEKIIQDNLLNIVQNKKNGLDYKASENKNIVSSARMYADNNGNITINQDKKIEGLIDGFLVCPKSKFDMNLISKFQRLEMIKLKNDLIKFLRILEPTLEDITVIGKEFYVSLEKIEEMIPLKLLGDGFINVFDIGVAVILGKNIILIDEIENGIHYSVLKEVIKMIFVIMSEKKELQLFISTHSMETIKLFVEIIGESEVQEDMLKLFRIDLDEESVNYTQKELTESIIDGWEVR